MENLRLGAKLGLKWVFIPFLIILVMSHNTFAASASGVWGISSGSLVLNGRTYSGSKENNNSRAWFFEWDSQTAYIYNGWVSSICVNLNGVIPKGAYFNTSIYFRTTQLNNTNFLGLSSDSDWGIVSQNVSNIDYTVGGTSQTNSIVVNVTGYNNGTNKSSFCFNPSNGADLFFNSVGNNNLYIRINPFSWYSPSDSSESINSINNKLDDLTDAVENQNQEEEDAVQDASDAADTAANENSSNAATTNLIGVISNFISAITNFSGSDCNITLAFPSYAGGSMNVNVCQNKDKAGNIISVFTSLSLIVFYLPLAFKLLSMIYNEIRSFTNG